MFKSFKKRYKRKQLILKNHLTGETTTIIIEQDIEKQLKLVLQDAGLSVTSERVIEK